ncbi:vacuolar ATP synthase subunit H, putative [Entamoeba histolytica HM-1:IMSS-B]|nr:vacuolar ATP synthase subunit H, putative [Entamoeba nuttalli P19]EMD46684.1 vacuolar ATP synthase subunit H, putative [Entamoeba histolytica KU27]EMH73285.1 vacuolar ATP synthase subunit H, putative [Entamoeba histolytica HM-1:IMSS-B]EMS11874.1 vacuolar ATP synthase subunit H, putative [Entamoeba histolytica HM-3:IMSS]ENY60301.1 vacuolar ATP synthase subunit H, putative [Entamoeba histolytica HM-1:IMSS-A]EKE37275.1 vacuolar ATP synthase subunit H, putative [Entamoeba nuttalli P19]|eukprot:XP_008860395.1 vacuolar ATP synthase subunit H, putative [Entamoeba nuttalli P19]
MISYLVNNEMQTNFVETKTQRKNPEKSGKKMKIIIKQVNMFVSPALVIPPNNEVFKEDTLNNAINNNSNLSDEKRAVLSLYLRQAPEERARIMNEVDLKSLIEIFYILLNQSEHPGVIENTTLLFDDFINADINRIPLISEIDIQLTIELCTRLIRQMKTENLTILKASIEVFTILTTRCGTFNDFVLIMGDYFQVIREIYSIANPTRFTYQPLHLFNWSLYILLNKEPYRTVFSKEIPLNFLLEVHDKIVATQDNELLYSLFHIVWLQSFDEKLVEHDFPENFIQIFANVLLKIKIEKLIRIVLLIIHNLLNVDWYVRLLVQHEFNLIIPMLLSRTFSDNDIVEMLQEINEIVEKKVTETSSMECYLDELKSGRMRWSPMHRSEQFWTENVTHFELENWALVRKLKGVINDKSADPVCVSVACFDLGEVARYHPLGRKIMNDLGIKLDLLQLTSSEQPDVKKNAIYAVQKIMLHHWDLVQTD